MYRLFVCVCLLLLRLLIASSIVQELGRFPSIGGNAIFNMMAFDLQKSVKVLVKIDIYANFKKLVIIGFSEKRLDDFVSSAKVQKNGTWPCVILLLLRAEFRSLPALKSREVPLFEKSFWQIERTDYCYEL